MSPPISGQKHSPYDYSWEAFEARRRAIDRQVEADTPRSRRCRSMSLTTSPTSSCTCTPTTRSSMARPR